MKLHEREEVKDLFTQFDKVFKDCFGSINLPMTETGISSEGLVNLVVDQQSLIQDLRRRFFIQDAMLTALVERLDFMEETSFAEQVGVNLLRHIEQLKKLHVSQQLVIPPVKGHSQDIL